MVSFGALLWLNHSISFAARPGLGELMCVVGAIPIEPRERTGSLDVKKLKFKSLDMEGAWTNYLGVHKILSPPYIWIFSNGHGIILLFNFLFSLAPKPFRLINCNIQLFTSFQY